MYALILMYSKGNIKYCYIVAGIAPILYFIVFNYILYYLLSKFVIYFIKTIANNKI